MSMLFAKAACMVDGAPEVRYPLQPGCCSKPVSSGLSQVGSLCSLSISCLIPMFTRFPCKCREFGGASNTRAWQHPLASSSGRRVLFIWVAYWEHAASDILASVWDIACSCVDIEPKLTEAAKPSTLRVWGKNEQR